MSFVHLHCHTEYSLLDGSARIKGIVKKAVELGMPALAITDHGVLYGAIDFYKECKKNGIKPIIGCEVYVAPRQRIQKEKAFDDYQYHLVLLAKNHQGYQNLLTLVSEAFVSGFYYKPRVDKQLLQKYSKGLICLSGCIAGEIPQLLLQNQKDSAYAAAREYLQIFGEGNFFLEISDHGIEEERIAFQELLQMSEQLGIPLVATNDVHYVEKQDARAHEILLCIQTGKTLNDEKRLTFPTQEFYLKSEKEMQLLFGEVPQALKNTLLIAKKCELDFEFDTFHLPDYQVPDGYDIVSYLKELCKQGLKRKYPSGNPRAAQRLDYELDVIEEMGFPGYFLIVWDLVNHAKEQGILVGPGRGSAAGSIVAYVLGITNIDPLVYDLLFERFLNPERITMPDIDIDFCFERRGEIIDYLSQRYGQEHVAQIITFGTMAAKAAVRDVGRVLGIPLPQVDKVAKVIPNELGITLEKAIEGCDELRLLYEGDHTMKELLDLAKEVEGLPRHASTHAAGVVISKERMTHYLPIQKTADGIITTQFPMGIVEEIGLLKMDILGLRTLTVIGHAVDLVKKNQGIEIDIDCIPLDDSKTYQMLGKGETKGVFQLESEGMRSILKNLKPEKFGDIIALVALYRPGPLGSGMVEDFIRRKHKEVEVQYLHRMLEPILWDTYGVILYQEQVMRIASDLAGFTLGQADLLRRAMGKKKPEIIARQKEVFIEGCVKNSIESKIAEEIFDLMAYFAGYGFNKSHSAAYALVAYQTAYLKANYPVEFMAALLSSIMNNSEKVTYYIDECRQLGIEVLYPDVNESSMGFNVSKNSIVFGLAAVKNVGESAIEAIIEARTSQGKFESLADFCCKVDMGAVNKRVLESLIKCGAFKSTNCQRSRLMAILDKAVEQGQRRQADKKSGQLSLFDFGQQDDWYEITIPQLAEYPARDILAMEKETLGFYLSGHPVEDYFINIKTIVTNYIDRVNAEMDGRNVVLAGVVTKIKRTVTKKGQAMAYLSLEDTTGSIECIVFPSILEKYVEFLQEDKVIKVEGRISNQNDELKCIVSTITKLQKDPAKKLYLKLGSEISIEHLEELRLVLTRNKGNTPVFLDFTHKGQRILTSRDYWVEEEGSLFELLPKLDMIKNIRVG